MIRAIVLGSVLAAACTAPVGPGAIRIEVVYGDPAPGALVSIGGYGVFGVVTNPSGEPIHSGQLNASELLTELPAGDYQLEVTLRPASDAILCDQNHDCPRQFMGVTATCESLVRVETATLTVVSITTFGQERCFVAAALA